MRGPRVFFTIDRLVLRGFAADQRDAIAAGLVAELRNHLGKTAIAGQFRASRSVASMRAAPMVVAPTAKSGQIGALAARGLVRSLRS